MNNFVELTFDEMLCVDGGKINSTTIAGACGAVYGAVVGAGAAAVCAAPVVAGSAAVIGIAGVGMAVVSLYN